MNLLTRYLLKQFTKYLLLVLCSLLLIYILVDFFERIDNFLEGGKTAGLAVRYLLLKLPLMCEQLIPVCILLAGVLTLGLLNHSRELLALKAGGVCLNSVLRPIIGGAIIVTLISLASSQWLLPKTMEACNTIWFQEVKKQIPRGIQRKGRTFFRGDNSIYSFIKSDQQKNLFNSFSFTSWDKANDLTMLLTAEEAIFKDGKWSMTKGQLKEKRPDGKFQVRVFNHIALPLPNSPKDFFVPAYKDSELTLSQLLHKVNTKQGPTARKALIDLHQRVSYIFLGIPLLLLGIPALLLVHQKWGRDLTLAIPLSCGLAFAAWGWWSASQALATAGYVHPAFSAWSMHLLAIFAGTFFIKRQNQ